MTTQVMTLAALGKFSIMPFLLENCKPDQMDTEYGSTSSEDAGSSVTTQVTTVAALLRTWTKTAAVPFAVKKQHSNTRLEVTF